MDTIFTDLDSPLADFTCNYIDGTISDGACKAYKEYLSIDKPLAIFVSQAKRGRQALQNAYKIQAADDFEEKLFKRIAREKEKSQSKENCTSV